MGGINLQGGNRPTDGVVVLCSVVVVRGNAKRRHRRKPIRHVGGISMYKRQHGKGLVTVEPDGAVNFTRGPVSTALALRSTRKINTWPPFSKLSGALRSLIIQ